MTVPICGLTPFTLQDFPAHTACILWFGGCNFRCAYCHNPELIIGKKQKLSPAEIFRFLHSRKGKLDGVVLSGGECTLAKGIEGFIWDLKALGFKVKLDTNGSKPDVLQSLLRQGLLDYVALDYKAPARLFKAITRWPGVERFYQSLEYLCKGEVPFEVRTTVHTSLLNEQDVSDIIEDLDARKFSGSYYLQNYNEGTTLIPLPKQTHMLDITALPVPKHFAIETRNFC